MGQILLMVINLCMQVIAFQGEQRKACGCTCAAFISRAVLKYATAVVESGKDTERYRRTLDLGNHHARNEHTWDKGQQCCWNEPVNADRLLYHTKIP